MTTSEAYTFLNSIRKIENEIVKLQLQHDELQSCLLPKAITYDGDRVQTSPEDKMLEIASRVLDMEKEIRDLKQRKAKLIIEINDSISKLDSDVEQMVLLGFYVGRLPAIKVAELVHYSVPGIYKVKRRAVIHLAEKCIRSIG
jgi:hypothetical protein